MASSADSRREFERDVFGDTLGELSQLADIVVKGVSGYRPIKGWGQGSAFRERRRVRGRL